MRVKKLPMAILLIMLLSIVFFSGCSAEDEHIDVYFETNGGTEAVEYITYVPFYSEKPITIANEPVTYKEGYIFAGWYTNDEFSGDRIVFPYDFYEDTILYAKWELDIRTPLEKYLDDYTPYVYDTTDLELSSGTFNIGDIIFTFDKTTQMFHADSSYTPYPYSIEFTLSYSFPLGDLSKGNGYLECSKNNSPYELVITKHKNVNYGYSYITVSRKVPSGETDWFRFINELYNPELEINPGIRFFDEIDNAFESFYNFCKSEYGLIIY